MAYSYYLNYEKVAIEIIEQQIELMTDDNVIYDETYDFDLIKEESFFNNLKAGSIALMFINNLFETAMNTILRRNGILNENKTKNVEQKLRVISEVYKFDLSEIKSNNLYCIYQNARTVRDDITHFKWNDLGPSFLIDSHIFLELGKERKCLAEIFTKKYIQDSYNSVFSLIDLICSKCRLAVNKKVQMIDCDGRIGAHEFINGIDATCD